MVKYTLIRYGAFQTLNVKIRVLLKQIRTMGTTAEVHLLPVDLQLGSHLHRFLSQAGWADNHILRFLEVLLGISDEQILAPLATETVLFPVNLVKYGLILADS